MKDVRTSAGVAGAASASAGGGNEDNLANMLPHQRELLRKRKLLERIQAGRHKLEPMSYGKIENGRPDKHYSWINRRPEEMVKFESLGYTVCKDDSVVTKFKREDGTHVRGDLILMEIPKEEYEYIQALNDYRSIEAMQDPHDQLAASAANAVRAAAAESYR